MVLLVKVEGTLDELREIFKEGKMPTSTARKKAAPKGVKVAKTKATKRAPSAYNKYMKKELARLKKKHPKTPHQTLFKRAAKSWKGSKKKGGRK